MNNHSREQERKVGLATLDSARFVPDTYAFPCEVKQFIRNLNYEYYLSFREEELSK